MAAGSWTLTNTTKSKILNGTFDFTNDTFKVAIVTSSSNISATSTAFASVTNELTTANGYTAGGATITFTVAVVATSNATLSFATNPTWTASGSGITGRWFVLYKVSGDVVAYCLGDSTPADFTVASGNVLTVDSDGTPSPVLTFS